MNNKISIYTVESGDWIAIYVNGILVDQGHRLTEKMVLEAVGIPFKSQELTEEQVDNMAGRFPNLEHQIDKNLLSE